jgi:polypeptide N-acetylgalactosaminyltransferase
MESIFRNTDDNLIKEIILLDDGSGSETVQRHAAKYLNQERFKKVHAFRSEKSDGHSLSRFKASKVATGSILVFLSHEVAVNKGWLEPLVDSVKSNRHMIIVPHLDSLLDGGRFFRTPDNLITTFSWTLDTAFMETKQEGTILTTPVMTGDAFAVDKNFLDSIGNFDEGMDKGYGENLELSLRTWLCGGSISISTCSRVSVRNALKPVRIHTARNFRRITELWLDEYKKFAYKQGEFGREGDDEGERQSLQTRRQYLKKITTCKPFKVFLKDTARDVVIPSDDAHYFGKLKSKTGYCLTNEIIENPKQTAEISMVLCKPHMYSPDMVFEFDFKGRIKNGGKCVEIMEEDNLQLSPCVVGRSTQIFELTSNGLISSLMKKEKCLMHATRTEGLQRVNFLAIRSCPTGPLEEERDFLWSVIRY